MVNALDKLEKVVVCTNPRIIKKSLKWFFLFLIFAFFSSCGPSPEESNLIFHLVWPPESAVRNYRPIRNQLIKSSKNHFYTPQADYLGVLNIRASLWDNTGIVEQVEYAYSLHEGRINSDPGTFLLRVEGLDTGNNVIYRGEVTSVIMVKGKATDAGEVLMQAVYPVPDSPSDLQSTVLSSSQIILTWTDSSDNESGFKIERKEGVSGAWADIKDISSNTTNYTDTGLVCETTYYYRVKSYNDEGDSDYSNESNAKTQTCPASIPSAPLNPQASMVSASEIDLSWTDNSNNEDGFKIERKVGSGTYSQVGTVGSGVTDYPDSGLTCAIKYYYRVKSYNGLGDSGYSTEIYATTGTCPTSAPTAPSSLTATVVSGTQINLIWTDKSNNEDGFKIERKTGTGGTYSQIDKVGANATGYQDMGLNCGTTYYYRVRATNSVGDSGFSNEILNKTNACSLTPPSAPSNLQVTVTSSSQINLTWTDNSSNEDGFKIERKTGSGGTYGQVGTVGGGVTAYSDTSLTCGSTFYYRVRAYNTVGDSSYTSEANGVLTCPATAPTAPSTLQASVVSSSQINLSWTDNSNNEDGFKIERKEDLGGTYIIVSTASANASSWANTGLNANTTYYYRIYAYNSVRSSSYSNEVYSTTQSVPTIGMASIPAGCFNMGDALNEGTSDERPVHNVCISAFQMDIYEVTNAKYKLCVDASVCAAPSNSSSTQRSSYYGNPTYDNFPVIWVDWNRAKTYCEWAGKRLPTEAEWEYAARGGVASKRYPWGNDASVCTVGANNGSQYNPCPPVDTAAVGSFSPNGYGLYDMAGNVWEWASDWWNASYYSVSPVNDPPGSDIVYERVTRGGGALDDANNGRVSRRSHEPQTQLQASIGFRCVVGLGSWTPTSIGTNVPGIRYGHTAIWTGTEMIIWGGTNDTDSLNTGGKYNPSTDSWLSTSTGTNLPRPRYDHAAVWTGTEMLIWGGNEYPSNMGASGSRYIPSTDSWTPLVGTNMPNSVGTYSYIWTGTEMIIWGGVYANQGFKYNLSTDTWTPTSTGTNVPGRRNYHTAVWTGSEMIVWGGRDWDNNNYLNTGGRYNPSTNSWTPTSIGTNVPSARFRHTAVWTGSEMIIWGGEIETSPYKINTGGRYNPSTDSWTPTSTGTNVPAEREIHTAVWTGAEMIIWGGYPDSGNQINTGGRYNPSTNSWTPTSTGTNVPGGRSYHTAVWTGTGTQMIIWGGHVGGTNLNTGGIYRP